jgi:hypothetical protein
MEVARKLPKLVKSSDELSKKTTSRYREAVFEDL